MDGRTEVESVASVAVESSCVTVTVPVADEIPAESRGYGGGEVEGVEESCDGGNKEEIMVGIVGSDVFVDVVSGNHDGSRDGLEEDSEVFVHVVSGNHGTCNDGLGGNKLGVDTVFVGSDAAVEEIIGFKSAGVQVFHGRDEILDEERNQIVSEERKGEVAAEVESAPEANGDTSIVVITTEVELRGEIEDVGVVDAVRDEVRTESLIDDKEVLTELETAKEEISCVGRSSHGGVLEEEAWNPGIVSASASCSVMLETDAVQHEIIREDSVAMRQVNSSSLDDKIMIAHEVIETAEVSVRDNADEASTYPLMIETDGVKQQEVAAVPQESISSFKDEIPSAHEVSVLDNENQTSTACPMMLETDGVQQEEVASTVEEINSASKDDIPVAHETATDHTSALYTPTVEADGMQQEQGAAVAKEINLSSQDEIPVDHEIAETGTELSVSANADHTSASCSLTFETDGMQQEEGAAMVEESTLSSKDELQVSLEEEGAAMVDESNLSSKDEFPVAHETMEFATEPFFSANADHTSASYPLTFQTDGLQQEKGSAMVEESKLSSKDEIPVVHEMTKTATELSVPDNTDHTSASSSLMLESDGVHQEDVAAMDEEISLSSKDAIPVAHETEPATEHSVTDNTDHASASCSLMLESDGGYHEIITEEDVVVLEVNKSTCKDETVVVDFASEPSVPDDANQTSASCPASLETDGVQNEVVKEESVPMLQENDSSFKDNIPGVHETNETAFKVANNSQVIDANGTHDITNRDSVSSFHHDASDCKVKAVHCTISPSDDKKDVNFGIPCSVEDSMEVNDLVNPAFFCQYIGSDIGVGTRHNIADKPQEVIEKEVVQESPVEFDIKPGNDNHRICSAENDLSMKQKVSCGNVGGEDVSPELTYEHLSDVDIVIDFDDVVDLKDEATDLDAPMEEVCCTGNTDDICAVPMTGDEELAQSGLSMLEVHEQVYTGNTEALASKEDEDVRELPDGNKFQQEIEKLDASDGGWSEKEGAISENTVVASDGQVIVTAACSVKSHETVIKREDSFPGTNPQSPVEMPDTSGTDLAVEGSVSSKTEKEDELVQANQINAHECQGDDKIFAEETIGSPNSHVQSKKEDEIHQANHIIGHELHGNEEVCAEGASGLLTCHVGFIDEGNNDNVFQDGKENMDTSGEVPEYDETMKASICGVASSSSDISYPIRSHELHGDDKISVEGDFGLPTSHVLTSGGCSVVLVTESNNDSVFLDESVKLNISADIHENETMETSICEVASSAGGISQVIEREDVDYKIMDIEEDASEKGKPEILESSSQPSSVIDEQTVGAEKYTSKSDRAKVLEERKIKPSSLLSVHQSGYFGPSETDGGFAVSDLVWGKVRSHPWWPGQIFDPSDASDRAVRYIKKDAYLVAYFGDRTFAWNDASVLKPFRPYFSQIVKQRNSEVMQIAIDSALEEVSRRVKLGLSCSCTPKDVYQKIECQIVENAGIREESSHRYGVDETSRAALFEPDKLVEHIRAVAQSPLNLCDRLELAIAEAQLSSFCHFKGYRPPPLFESRETSFEDVPGTSIDEPDCEIIDFKLVSSRTATSHRQKETLNDSVQPKKERSLSELTIHTEFSPDDDDGMDDEVLSKSMRASFGKKRKAMDSVGDNSDKRVSIYAAKLSTTSSSPKTPSFKVGDCIRRVATQLTGASSSLKASSGQSVGDAFLQPCSSSPRENVMLSPESSSTSGDMLSQLQLLARDPKKRCGLLKNIIVFLSDFRNSVVSKHAVSGSGGKRKRKTSHPVGNSNEEFEFDDVNDSYWKDKAIENCHDEQLLRDGDKGDDVYQQEVVSPPAKVHKPTRRPYTRKKHSTENYEPLADEPMEEDQSMKRGTSPAELIMNFVKGSRIPSQISLNNMFRRFGSLKEYETEVDQDSCRARVIFKKGVDAEVAYSSAGTFNIFGAMQVTYQLSYSPTSTCSELPPLISQGQEVGT